MEEEYRKLEGSLIDRKTKPPQQMKEQSQKEFSLEENMQLKDQVFHLQNVNNELTKSIQVKLKAELSQTMEQKEAAETKLKQAKIQIRQK